MNEHPITALVVDDARLARKELLHLLKAQPEIHALGEAESAAQARELIAEHAPDVLFLDIQMPGEDGFELLESLDHAPQVIFTTAYDQYAIRAFEHNALDYLQKPVDPAALARAIKRLATRVKPAEASRNAAHPRRVFVKDGEACWFVPVERIRLLEVDGHYTTLHFDDAAPMIAKTLNQLESRLDPALFFRANRNQMINLQHIEDVQPWVQGVRVRLSDGRWVELSRRQSQAFRARMSL